MDINFNHRQYLLHGWPEINEVVIFDSWYEALCNYQANREKWKGILPLVHTRLQPSIKRIRISFAMAESLLQKSKKSSVTIPTGCESGYVLVISSSYYPELLRITVRQFSRYWKGRIYNG